VIHPDTNDPFMVHGEKPGASLRSRRAAVPEQVMAFLSSGPLSWVQLLEFSTKVEGRRV
jgi:hypothetical protein